MLVRIALNMLGNQRRSSYEENADFTDWLQLRSVY